MILNIVLFLIVAAALYFSTIKEGYFQKAITVGLGVAIVVPHINAYASSASLFLGASFFASMVYCLVVSGLNLLERFAIGLYGLLGLLFMLVLMSTKIMHWPVSLMFLASLMAIPLVLFIASLVQSRFKLKREFGFLLLLSIIALNYLISFVLVDFF